MENGQMENGQMENGLMENEECGGEEWEDSRNVNFNEEDLFAVRF